MFRNKITLFFGQNIVMKLFHDMKLSNNTLYVDRFHG